MENNRHRFDFLDIRISAENIGHREKYNHFLMGDGAVRQLDMLIDDYEGYIPIGVCIDENYLKDYGGYKYYPVVLENNDGDRIWIHCPYSGWKELVELGLI